MTLGPEDIGINSRTATMSVIDNVIRECPHSTTILTLRFAHGVITPAIVRAYRSVGWRVTTTKDETYTRLILRVPAKRTARASTRKRGGA